MTTPEEGTAGATAHTRASDPLRFGAHPSSPHRDAGLLHQPIVSVEHGGQRLVVSCNCLLEWHGGAAYYPPMGQVHDRFDTQALFNNPRNHKQPLTSRWKIHYKDVDPPRLTVNDRDHMWSNVCWICNESGDHTGVPHGVATGDGLTRLDIVEFMDQGGYRWRDGQ